MQILKNIKLLLVEDDAEIRGLLKGYFKNYFGSVIEGCDGDEGWELFQKHLPDVVITDVMMPKSTGVALAQKIAKCSDALIYFISGCKDSDVLLDVIHTHPRGYLLKPISSKKMNEILEEIAAILNKTSKNTYRLACGAEVDFEQSVILRNGTKTILTKKELELFKLLSTAEKKVIPYSVIEKELWGESSKGMTDDSIRSLLYRIRKKSSKECIRILSNIGMQEG